MKVVDTNAYLSELREIIAAGGDVSVPVSGGSMTPFLIHGRDQVHLRKPNRRLKKGDIVLYQRANGQFVLHRIVRVHGDRCDLLGDAQTLTERNVPRTQIFALAVFCCRKGKWIGPRSLWWKFFAHVWPRLRPVRRPILGLYTRLFH